MEHTECVADTGAILEGLAKLANIPFNKDDFSDFEDSFVESGEEDALYSLKGSDLAIAVRLEKYEGYFFVSIHGEGECFEKAKEYLSSAS